MTKKRKRRAIGEPRLYWVVDALRFGYPGSDNYKFIGFVSFNREFQKWSVCPESWKPNYDHVEFFPEENTRAAAKRMLLEVVREGLVRGLSEVDRLLKVKAAR